jgi:hypothetical protein
MDLYEALRAGACMIRGQKSPEEIAEDEARTTPTGIFNTAISYWKAADALAGLALKTPRNHAPVRFLYFHALELYLKAYLRADGYTLKRLEGIGHSFTELTKRAPVSGLKLAEDDIELMRAIGNSDMVIRARYIRTGAVIGWLPTKLLHATCRRLNEMVGHGLKEKGILVML